jgi:hypothetical protein
MSVSEPRPLPAEALCSACNPELFEFETTADLPEAQTFVGQERAAEAVAFGIAIQRAGYNLFAIGPPGTGKHSLVRRLLRRRARTQKLPADWVYVFNFDEPHRPRAISLPPGRALPLRTAMTELVDDLRAAIPAAFESDTYRARREALEGELKGSQDEALTALNQEALSKGILLTRTPTGFAFMPAKDGEPMEPKVFAALPAEEQQRIGSEIEALQKKLQELFRSFMRRERDARERLRQLNRDTTAEAVTPILEVLRERFGDLPAVVAHLAAVERDCIENARMFLGPRSSEQPPPEAPPTGGSSGPGNAAAQSSAQRDTFFRRYQINVMVDQSRGQGAQVIDCDHPSHGNL